MVRYNAALFRETRQSLKANASNGNHKVDPEPVAARAALWNLRSARFMTCAATTSCTSAASVCANLGALRGFQPRRQRGEGVDASCTQQPAQAPNEPSAGRQRLGMREPAQLTEELDGVREKSQVPTCGSKATRVTPTSTSQNVTKLLSYTFNCMRETAARTREGGASCTTHKMHVVMHRRLQSRYTHARAPRSPWEEPGCAGTAQVCAVAARPLRLCQSPATRAETGRTYLERGLQTQAHCREHMRARSMLED